MTAQKQGPKPQISLGPNARLHTRMLVSQRFHIYCQTKGIVADKRMPYGAMKTFIADNISWTAKHKVVSSKTIRGWYAAWRSSASNVVVAAVADKDAPVQVSSPKGFLRSRAPVPLTARRRASGVGRPHKAYCVREALYEWFLASVMPSIGSR